MTDTWHSPTLYHGIKLIFVGRWPRPLAISEPTLGVCQGSLTLLFCLCPCIVHLSFPHGGRRRLRAAAATTSLRTCAIYHLPFLSPVTRHMNCARWRGTTLHAPGAARTWFPGVTCPAQVLLCAAVNDRARYMNRHLMRYLRASHCPHAQRRPKHRLCIHCSTRVLTLLPSLLRARVYAARHFAACSMLYSSGRRLPRRRHIAPHYDLSGTAASPLPLPIRTMTGRH